MFHGIVEENHLFVQSSPPMSISKFENFQAVINYGKGKTDRSFGLENCSTQKYSVEVRSPNLCLKRMNGPTCPCRQSAKIVCCSLFLRYSHQQAYVFLSPSLPAIFSINTSWNKYTLHVVRLYDITQKDRRIVCSYIVCYKGSGSCIIILRHFRFQTNEPRWILYSCGNFHCQADAPGWEPSPVVWAQLRRIHEHIMNSLNALSFRFWYSSWMLSTGCLHVESSVCQFARQNKSHSSKYIINS